MLIKETKYSFNDVCIQPAVLSTIKHRSECNSRLADGKLPIFASPMSTVVNEKNFDIFENHGITPILPRNINFNTRMEYALNNKWAAFSLKEFEDNFTTESSYISNMEKSKAIKALIDVANGHMEIIFGLAKKAKDLYGNHLTIMVGNIANPETYIQAVASGVDFIRAGIGGGSGCITSSNTSIHYPYVSLIAEIDAIRTTLCIDGGIPYEKQPKVIIDGGIRNYSDVIKALAVGADYVMIGGLFSQLIESASPIYMKDENGINIPISENATVTEQDGIFTITENGHIFAIDELWKTFYGMASKYGQIAINGSKTKTSEGIKKEVKVSTNITKWVENMDAYLKSAMSYCDIRNVENMRQVNVYLMSNNTYNSINK